MTQTLSGLFIKDSTWAYSSGLYFSQRPPLPLKGGIEDPTEIPAPVKATQLFDLNMSSAAFLIKSS
jgi:hypothetical protein